MIPFRLRWTLAAAVIGVVLLAGCSSKQSSSETPAGSSQATTPAAAPNGASEHGEPSEAVAPAGTVSEIWSQIESEQGRLATAIQNGELKHVHPLAFGIRDLAVALAGKASAASPASAAQLAGMVGQIKASASRLDELGDAGNLSGTQAESAKLDAILNALKSVPGAR